LSAYCFVLLDIRQQKSDLVAMLTISLYLCDFLIPKSSPHAGKKERGAACYPLCGEISGRIRSHFKAHRSAKSAYPHTAECGPSSLLGILGSNLGYDP